MSTSGGGHNYRAIEIWRRTVKEGESVTEIASEFAITEERANELLSIGKALCESQMADLHIRQGDLLGPFEGSEIDLRMMNGERFSIVLRCDEPSTRIRYYIDSDGLFEKEVQPLGSRRSNPCAYMTDREEASVLARARTLGYTGPDPATKEQAKAIHAARYAKFMEDTKGLPLIE